mmetsp:Transcript_56373/g.121467  ORF Transcript_56373/g.121467 Transcript_56373/m.121467 type:complete len:240 (+) Transcript_56373:1906-2625(+)
MTMRRARCPARKTTHPSWGVGTECTSGAGTTLSDIASSAASDSTTASSAAGGEVPSRCARRLCSMRLRICSQSLSGHRRAGVSFAVVEVIERSKDKSMAACAAPNHSAGTVPRAKFSITTWVTWSDNAQKCFCTSSGKFTLAHCWRRWISWQTRRARSSCSPGVEPQEAPPAPTSWEMRGNVFTSSAALAPPRAVSARSAMGHAEPCKAVTKAGMAAAGSMSSFSVACWKSSCTLAKWV